MLRSESRRIQPRVCVPREWNAVAFRIPLSAILTFATRLIPAPGCEAECLGDADVPMQKPALQSLNAELAKQSF